MQDIALRNLQYENKAGSLFTLTEFKSRLHIRKYHVKTKLDVPTLETIFCVHNELANKKVALNGRLNRILL